MKAIVYHGVGDIRLDNVPEPKIQDPTDAIVRLTHSAICGTDLHMVRGTMSGMVPGTILGHEGVGVVEECGKNVRNMRKGDRVVIPSTVGCGYCSYCRAGYFAQCDNANPNGKRAGTVFFGGPKPTGPLNGLQAEYARVPFANVGLVKIPDTVSDDKAILLSDIFPTGYFGAELAEITPGDIVLVFGCGPVGQFAILSAMLLGAGRVIAVDRQPDRLDKARAQGAEVVDFEREDPVEAIMGLTGGVGADRVIDAVGVDAEPPKAGPAAEEARQSQAESRREVQAVAPETNPQGELWKPGEAPSQVMRWAMQTIAKAGALSVIGVYPETVKFFPFGMAMNMNLTIKAGNCNHRRYIPRLMDLVESGAAHPETVLTQQVAFRDAVGAYQAFDLRREGWTKVELNPSAAA